MPDSGARERLTKWERWGLALFVAVILVFGVFVVRRTAYINRRMGDLGVYLRTAWAVRAGVDIYSVADENDWHYVYPPLFAILMVPLADAPDGADRTGLLPFGASAAIWLAFSLLCLAVASHTLASALETTAADSEVRIQPRGCRRWWMLRFLPVLACLVPIGHTLARNQINLLILALLCWMMAAMLRGRSGWAGFALGWAIALKVIPAFLLIYPLWRRDGRFVAGCAGSLILGLAAIPISVFGPQQTWNYYREFAQVTLGPALGMSDDDSRAKELIESTATDSQSLASLFHNTLHLDRATRPLQPSVALRATVLGIGGLMALLVLLPSGRHSQQTGPYAVLPFALLIVVMMLMSPVSHLHYNSLLVPLVMALVAIAWQQHPFPRLGWLLTLALGFNVIVNILPNLPNQDEVRDLAVSTYGTLFLWGIGCVALWRQRRGLPEIGMLGRGENKAAA